MRKQWQSGPQDVERKRTDIRLGLQANLLQFSLLVLVNAFVGAMAGLERSILPALAEQEFQLAARSAILSFIAVFGLTKALTNYAAGRWSDRFGRKPVLVAGWLIAVPVPFLLMWAPSWSWVIVANGLQPGTDLVDHGDHEDRSGRSSTARTGDGFE
jgi:MFS family permease